MQEAKRELHFLHDNKFVRYTKDEAGAEHWEARELGSAACAAGLSPENARLVLAVRFCPPRCEEDRPLSPGVMQRADIGRGLQDLKQAMYGGLILATEVHLTFLVTPVGEDIISAGFAVASTRWERFRRAYYQLVRNDPVMQRVAQNCGVTERLITK